MKAIWKFWDKRSSYEKAVLGLFAAYMMFCLGYFSVSLYTGAKCDVCRQTLKNGGYYILDARTGEILNVSDYVNQESSGVWLSPVGHVPQEFSLERQVGYMRFPRQPTRTARYCSRHTSGLDSDFLVLEPTKEAAVCYAVFDSQILYPDGWVVIKRLNDELNCWELEIGWN